MGSLLIAFALFIGVGLVLIHYLTWAVVNVVIGARVRASTGISIVIALQIVLTTAVVVVLLVTGTCVIDK